MQEKPMCVIYIPDFGYEDFDQMYERIFNDITGANPMELSPDYSANDESWGCGHVNW